MNYPWVTMALGAAIFAIGLYCKIWPTAPAIAPQNEAGGVMTAPSINYQGIITHGQTGGANTVVNQRPDREMDAEFRRALLLGVPKSNQIKLMVLNGDPERDRWADQIERVAKAEGYTVLSPHFSFVMGSGGKTPEGTIISPDEKDPNVTVIMIGVNNR
jgi:hypothetical protein